MIYPNLQATATLNGGATIVLSDLSQGLLPDVLVTATQPIRLLHFLPNGALPTRPFLAGSEIAKGQDDGTYIVAAGRSVRVFFCESLALVAAGAATLA